MGMRWNDSLVWGEYIAPEWTDGMAREETIYAVTRLDVYLDATPGEVGLTARSKYQPSRSRPGPHRTRVSHNEHRKVALNSVISVF